jgi:hypothetical protein
VQLLAAFDLGAQIRGPERQPGVEFALVVDVDGLQAAARPLHGFVCAVLALRVLDPTAIEGLQVAALVPDHDDVRRRVGLETRLIRGIPLDDERTLVVLGVAAILAGERARGQTGGRATRARGQRGAATGGGEQ